ncbi:MAG TPA: AAA family ATPase, partial [Ktedonobacteraceae bacterium]|nr:AAA family ATPase [Ktedonobacteraceae bacterium]
MLKSWSIENFKAIVNSGDLKLAPITILAGKNSSGKSSLLQSILMIAQTLSNQNRDLALLTNGDLTKLRTFEDILSDHSHSRALTIQFELSDELNDMKPAEDVYNLYDSSNHKITVTFVSAIDIDNRSSAIENSKVFVEKILMKAAFQYHLPNIVENSTIPGVVDGYRSASFEFDFVVEKIADDQFKTFLMNVAPDYLRLISSSDSYLGRIKGYSGTDRFFLLSMFHFLPTRIMRKSPLDDGSEGLELANNDQNIIFLGLSIDHITQFFTNQIRYLGPFRAKPDITAQGFSTKGSLDDVGTEGELAASVYHANQNAAIDWYNPASKQVEQGTLKVALDTWVQHLN